VGRGTLCHASFRSFIVRTPALFGTQFIRESVGTQDFDSQSEIWAATRHVMEAAQLHDEAQDNLADTALSMQDMQLFWEDIGTTMRLWH